MFNINYPKSFQKHLKTIFKKFPRSKKRITRLIENLAQNPVQGDMYPGFGDLEVRKIRLSLSEYNIGKSKGLRLIYLFLVLGNKIIPLAIYQKNKFAAEDEIKRMLIDRIKEIAHEIKDQKTV